MKVSLTKEEINEAICIYLALKGFIVESDTLYTWKHGEGLQNVEMFVKQQNIPIEVIEKVVRKWYNDKYNEWLEMI